MSARRAVPVTALAAACFVVSAEARVVAPLLPTIAASLGVSVTAAGSAVTLYLLPYGLCQIGYGPLADRIGKFRVIRACMLVLAAGTLACALAPSLVVLDVLRLLTGMAAAAIFPMSMAHLGDTLPYGERPRAIGILMSGAAVGQTLSIAIGGAIGQFLDWRLVFLLYGAIALGIGLWLAQFAPAAAASSSATSGEPWWRPYARLLASPTGRTLYLMVAVEGFFAMGAFTYVTALLQWRDGLSQLAASLVVTANGVGAFTAARLLGHASHRLGERGSLVLGGLGAGVPYLLLAAPIGVWPAAPLLLVMGAGWVLMHNVLQVRATEASPEARGSSLAFFALSLFLGGSLGTTAHGLLIAAPGSYATVMAVGGLGLCTFGLLAPARLGVARRRPRPAPAAAGPSAG
ncbi:MAG TPA: MFS transporter [Thermodesulfobacteriota bacterium]